MPATDPTTFAAACVQDLVTAFRPAMEQMGQTEMLGGMQTLISVPVQYVAYGSRRPAKPKPIGGKPGPGLTQRPGLGHAVVRSKRHEAPRKEFGFLYKSMKTETVVEGNRIITRLWSDDSIAGYSERLEEQLDRPHFSTIFERAEQHAVDWVMSRVPQRI